ncbi:MAG: nitrite reductase small subunit NirD [Burkholderiaceae bacterium]
MTEWIEVCAVDDIAPLSSRKLHVGELTIALIRADTDTIYAIEDRCPHKGGPLSEGIVSHDRVACPLHNQCVNLATGELIAPDQGRVRTFRVQLRDAKVLMDRGELCGAVAPAPAPALCAG